MISRCATDLEREQFYRLVFEFADIFAQDGEIDRTRKIKHSIHTGNAQPSQKSPTVPETGDAETAHRDAGEGCDTTVTKSMGITCGTSAEKRWEDTLLH